MSQINLRATEMCLNWRFALNSNVCFRDERLCPSYLIVHIDVKTKGRNWQNYFGSSYSRKSVKPVLLSCVCLRIWLFWKKLVVFYFHQQLVCNISFRYLVTKRLNVLFGNAPTLSWATCWKCQNLKGFRSNMVTSFSLLDFFHQKSTFICLQLVLLSIFLVLCSAVIFFRLMTVTKNKQTSKSTAFMNTRKIQVQ